MDTEFELFDLISGNVLDTFPRECDAIEALVEIARESGEGEVARFALTQDQDGQITLVAMKDDLVRRVAAELGKARIPASETDVSALGSNTDRSAHLRKSKPSQVH